MGKTIKTPSAVKLINPKTGKECNITQCLDKFERIVETKTWVRNELVKKGYKVETVKRSITFKHPFHRCRECGRKIAFRGDTEEARSNYHAVAFGFGKQKEYDNEEEK